MGGAGEAGGSNLNSCGDLLADCLLSRDITQLRISATYSSSAKKHPDLDICYLHLKLVGEPLNLIQEYLEIFILFLLGGRRGHVPNQCKVNQWDLQIILQQL